MVLSASIRVSGYKNVNYSGDPIVASLLGSGSRPASGISFFLPPEVPMLSFSTPRANEKNIYHVGRRAIPPGTSYERG